MSIMNINTKNYSFVRNKLLNKEEIAFLDVREEDPHAQEHPLFAANLPLSRIEFDAYGKLPRKNVPIVTLDDGEGLADLAAQRLIALGYSDVSVFENGFQECYSSIAGFFFGNVFIFNENMWQSV